MMEEVESGIKRGYLKDDFRFFHIKDKRNIQFEAHYHDFNKIIIFLEGEVTYLIEGRNYKLKPWDILLVRNNEVHLPVINFEKNYDRIILWVNSTFLENHSTENDDLLSCFRLAEEQKNNLLRLRQEQSDSIKYIIHSLENACRETEFGHFVLQNSLFLQFIVHINRFILNYDRVLNTDDITHDAAIMGVLLFINENLSSELTIDNISSRFFLNKYYLMHKFKEQTGYTIHNYIVQKRIIMAGSLIKNGSKMTDACIESGFGDYSSFVRAFKRIYGESPKKYYKYL